MLESEFDFEKSRESLRSCVRITEVAFEFESEFKSGRVKDRALIKQV